MNISPELQSILTVVVVGIVSFLIGRLLASSKWKSKYHDAQLQADNLVAQTTSLTNDLNKAKKQLVDEKENSKTLERSIDDHNTKLSSLQRNLNQAQSSRSDEVNKLQAQLDLEKRSASTLQDQVHALEAKVASAPIMSVSKKKKSKKKIKKAAEVNPSVASKKKAGSGKKKKLKKIISRISTVGDTQVDDLTTITGIGPEISEKLNKMGIVNYRQLSLLQDADLETIDKSLKFFPGRAYRNNWVGQARVLADKVSE